VDLGVALLERHVGRPLGGGQGPGPLDQRPADVEAERVAARGAATGGPGQPAGAAADVEHPVAVADARADQHRLAPGGQPPVVAMVVGHPVLAAGAVPQRRHLGVALGGDHSPRPPRATARAASRSASRLARTWRLS
jgi:hypothetical protein